MYLFLTNSRDIISISDLFKIGFFRISTAGHNDALITPM